MIEEIRGMFEVVSEGHGALRSKIVEHQTWFKLINTQMNITRSDITELRYDVDQLKSQHVIGQEPE